jgi:hypothetical protein
VVFDPDLIRDAASFEQPHRYAEGISLVMVGGQVAFDGEAVTAVKPGRVLYGPARALALGARTCRRRRAERGALARVLHSRPADQLPGSSCGSGGGPSGT